MQKVFNKHIYDFMSVALDQAKLAFSEDEIPIGAVVVRGNNIIGIGRNMVEQKNNPLYHAELVAINEACKTIKDKYLYDCDLYVTLEPCVMCTGAIINSRLRNLYFGAFQPKFGACGSVFNIPELNKLNHKINVFSGIFSDQSEELLAEYFIKKRQINR
jgi:tRNA(adenine34) deaminase